jgi:hypothetical protein
MSAWDVRESLTQHGTLVHENTDVSGARVGGVALQKTGIKNEIDGRLTVDRANKMQWASGDARALATDPVGDQALLPASCRCQVLYRSTASSQRERTCCLNAATWTTMCYAERQKKH